MQYSFTRLNDVKPEMIAQATQRRARRRRAVRPAIRAPASAASARRPRAISRSARATATPPRKAAGGNDSPFQKVRVVTTIEFYLRLRRRRRRRRRGRRRRGLRRAPAPRPRASWRGSPRLAAGLAVGRALRRRGGRGARPPPCCRPGRRSCRRAAGCRDCRARALRARAMSVAARAGIVLAPGERRREIPGERIGRHELERAVEIRRGRRSAWPSATWARARSRCASPRSSWLEVGRGQRGVERLQRARRLAGGEPGIAGLDPEIGAARLVAPPRPRAPPARRRSPPPAIARARHRRGRGTGAPAAPPRSASQALAVSTPPAAARLRTQARCRRAAGRRRRGPGGAVRRRRPARRHRIGAEGSDWACAAASARKDRITVLHQRRDGRDQERDVAGRGTGGGRRA